MTELKHTPGPWRIGRMERPPIGRQPNGEPWPTDVNGNVFWGYSISGSNENGASILPTLAAVHNFPGHMEANARLIAAAPELLQALRDLDEAFCSRHGCFPLDTVTEEQRLWNRAMTNARAAIAKATGAD